MFGMASDETDALKIQTYICIQTKILTQKSERVDLTNTQQQSLLLRPHKTGELIFFMHLCVCVFLYLFVCLFVSII